jgi:hypothetical protein
MCRDPWGGFRHLPDPGGVNNQSAWLMDAFEIVGAAFHASEPKRPPQR